MAAKKNQLFALWKYDRFPYLLGGHVRHVEDNGNVITEEYGLGFAFKPVIILPAKNGKALLDLLVSLKNDYDKERESLAKKHGTNLRGILAEHGLKNIL